MSHYNQHVTDEGSTYHDKGQTANFHRLQSAPVCVHQIAGREGNRADERVSKHPLHDGDERIFVDKILEAYNVERITELCEQD